MVHIHCWIKRTAIVFALTALCGYTNIAIASQVGGQVLTIQPSGATTTAQMQQADTALGLAPVSTWGRSVPIMPTPIHDMGYLPLPYTAALQPVAQSLKAQQTQPLALAPSFTGFQALPDNQSGIPPDTMGAVGPNHVVTMLNSQMRIQNRVGTIISTVTLTNFWTAPQTGLSGSPFDPHVVYDTLSKRWIATCNANAKNVTSQVWFAISATIDPTGVWT